MSSESQVALIVGITSATSALIGALGGTGIGWWLNGKSQRRAEKRTAFVELLSAIDECQHACNELSVLIRVPAAEPDLGPNRVRALAAVNRVETAGNMVILSVGRDREQIMKGGMIACAKELAHANHGVDTMGIVEARIPVLELARNETR